MIVSTQNQLDGYQVMETLGLVQGSTIRARHIGTDIQLWLVDPDRDCKAI